MEKTRIELKILRKAVESLQQSKCVENFSTRYIFPVKTELEIRKLKRKCLDSSFRDTVVYTRCYIQ